jgi:maltose-binding protein MalE
LLDTWVANFTEANEGIEVETVFVPFDDLRATYENAAATGEGPDLLIGQADWAGPLSEAGLIMPVDDLVAETDLDTQLTEAAWGTMSYAGERYGIPVTLDGVALYYNSDIIDADDIPTDLEELLEVAAELTEGDDVGLMFNNGFYHSAGIYFALGGELFDEEGSNLWNESDAAEAYLEIHQMIFEEYPEFITGDNSLFQEGRAAMIVDGQWNLGTYTESLGDSLGVARLPEIDGEPWSPFVGGKGFYVNSTTENVDNALAFLTYVTSAEGLTLGAEIASHVPTGEGIEVENENIGIFSEQLSGGTPLPTSPTMGAYWNPVQEAITAVTEGGEEPAAAAEAATENITALLEGEG